MKIKYEFADGTVSEVEVEQSIGAIIIEDRRLEDDEIAAILVKADELAAWAADVKEFALQQALSGVKYVGFKIVEGRSNRKYTDEDAVAETVKKAGLGWQPQQDSRRTK